LGFFSAIKKAKLKYENNDVDELTEKLNIIFFRICCLVLLLIINTLQNLF